MSDIVERLRAPAYWISGSNEGHEGDNAAPLQAAADIERLRKALTDIYYTTREVKTAAKAKAALEGGE